MKKKSFVSVLIAVLIIGLFSGFAVSTETNANSKKSRYPLNEKGLTYGHVDPRLPPLEQEYPQLIAATGIDGTQGYVYAEELNGKQPSSPEETAIYMDNLEKETKEALIKGQEYLRYIPLYESDGITIIGQFGISYCFDVSEIISK